MPTFTRHVVPGDGAWRYHDFSVADPVTLNRALATDIEDLVIADFDGDGRDDLLFRIPTIDSKGNVADTPESTFATATWLISFGSPTGPTTPTSANLPRETIAGRAFDLDGDGAAEFLTSQLSNRLFQTDKRIFRWATGGFQELAGAASTSTASSSPLQYNSADVVTGDLNGDAIADLLRDEDAQTGNSDTTFLRLALGAQANTLLSPFRLVDTGGNYVQADARGGRLVADIRGSGKASVLLRLAPTPQGQTQATLLPHLSEMLLHAPTNATLSQETTISASKLVDSVVAKPWSTSIQANSPLRGGLSTWLVDVTGDGLPDAVTVPSAPFFDSSFVLISRNSGGSFRRAESVGLSRATAPGPGLYFSGPGVRQVDPGIRFGDFDQDGRADVLLVGPSNAFIDPCFPQCGATPSPSRVQMTLLRWTGATFDASSIGIPITHPGHYSAGPLRRTSAGQADSKRDSIWRPASDQE